MKKSEAILDKICDETKLLHKISVWRFLGRKIIFTNGCFDILHPGHMHLLNNAADTLIGAALIVGLNTDESVKKLKGNNRPVNTYEDRALLLANLYVVDAVMGFSESTPSKLIEIIKPDVLVKGGDYTEDKIAGAEFVRSYGGDVVIIPFLENYSSTSILSRAESNL